MRIRKLRVAVALSVVSFLAGWAALAPPADPPVPSRSVPDPRECVSTATLASAVEVFGDPPRNDQMVAYVAGDLPAGDLAGLIREEAAAIAVLRQAADCGEVGPMGAGRTFDAFRIAQLAIVEARGRMAAEPEAALDELLDAWSIGLDLGQSGALVEVHVSAALGQAAADGILDLLEAEDLDASALSAARERVDGFRQRPIDLEAATARDVRAYWAYLAYDPRAVLGYARWQWVRHFRARSLLTNPEVLEGPELSGPEGILQSAWRSQRDADLRLQLATAALERAQAR